VKVAVYLFGDPSHDGRVLKEARSLAEAGHEVTLLARLHAERRGTPPQIPGVRFVDVPPPPSAWFTFNVIRRPWRLAAWVRASWSALRRPRPGTLGRAVAATVLAPWVGVGLLWQGVSPERPDQDGLLDEMLFWRFHVRSWCEAAARKAPAADVHHAHDLTALPAGVAGAARGGRLVYDCHEIFLESGRHARHPAWYRRRLAAWERGMAQRADAVITVNDRVAAELRTRLAPKRTVVVHNCPPAHTGPFNPALSVRTRLGLAPDVPIALYHGGLSRHRGLEVLAAAIREPGLPGVHAVFMGYGPEQPAVERLAADPAFGGRVHLLGAVAPDEVVDAVAGADVAVMPIEPSTRNHVFSTPNKLFEALAAGVPAVVSDFPEMRGIVLEDPEAPLGEVCDPASPASVALAIGRILALPADERKAMRARCLAASRARWNWDSEVAGLLALYQGFASGRAPA
jgi:glycosyltransferase involved in cell wall biosynthesis